MIQVQGFLLMEQGLGMLNWCQMEDSIHLQNVLKGVNALKEQIMLVKSNRMIYHDIINSN